MKRQRSIVTLAQVPPEKRHLLKHCLYCYCPRHPRAVLAVAAVMVEELNQFYGICGHHAEVYPLTEEQRQQRLMLCPHCHPRKDG